MSISTTATKITYVGNNSNSTAYPITFKYFDSDHVTVYADGVEISSGGLNYCTFAGDGAAGTGEFTTSLAYAPTVSVVVVLDVPLDQPVVLQETGSLPAKTLEEDGFDRLNMQIRRVWRKVQDVLRFDTTENDASTGTADTLIGFDNAGDIEEVAKSTFLATANNLSDVDAATARTNLNVDPANTDNSTDVTLAGTGTYISLGAGQIITVDPITASDVTDFDAEVGNHPDVTANTSSRHDAATKTGTGTYVSLTGQAINVDPIQDGDIDSEAATSDKILKSDGASGAAWSNVEGTEVASTGEATGSKFLRENGDGSCSWIDLSGLGAGDALIANPLSQFASTTSAQLAGVISDETGTGALVFGTSPSLTTPNLGTPSAIDLTNATNTPLPASDSITYDMVQDVTAADKILGSVAGGTVEEIACTSAGRALLDDADAATQRATLGVNLVFNVKNYGTVGNGTTDDRAAIQAAIDAAELVTDAVEDTGVAVGRSAAVVDLAGGRYRIADTLLITKPIIFQNGSLIATTAMTGTTASVDAPTYMLYVNAPYAVIQNIKLDGGTDGAYATATACLNDLVRTKGVRTEFNNVDGWHFDAFGFNSTGGYHQSFNNCDMVKWTVDDTVGYGDDTHHSGVAFYTTNYAEYYGCYAEACSTGWQLNGVNNRLSNCRFDGGNPTFTTAIEAKAVHIQDGSNHLVGCMFDGGDVYIDQTYYNMISACRFILGNNTAGIVVFNGSSTNTSVSGLTVTGCAFSNSATGIEFTTSGGSYVDDIDKNIHWLGNMKSNGNDVWHGNKFGDSGFWDDGRLTIADRASAPATIAGAATIWVTTGGILRVKFQNGVIKDIANDV